ncbi:MAG: CoA transferase [Blastocatellia bacterium]
MRNRGGGDGDDRLYERKIRRRHGNRWEDLYPITTLPCRDGYVSFAMPTLETWERLCRMMERPDLINDERFATPQLCRERADELDEILAAWLSRRDMAELFATAQEQWRLALNPYLELDQVLRDPRYVARGFWAQGDSPDAARTLWHPGAPVIMSETPGRIGHAPKLSEHDDLLRATVARTFEDETGDRRDAGKIPATAPLAGLRVLDLTRVWSGPLCTRILADLGAEVIKIEPPLPPVPSPIAPTASLKLNRNKLSVGIDLNLSAGRDLLRRLATRADVLVENFSARVMPKFELDYVRLRELNPRLIYLAMSGYGTTGPYRDYVAYGSSTEAMIGLTALLGYPGEEPRNSAIAYPDAVGGLAGAAAILTALVYRARTGREQFLDLSQLEATTLMLGEFFIAEQLEGQPPAREGNTHPVWAPHGTYRCRGADEWVSLAIRSDEEWMTFCRCAGLAALGGDTAYRTVAGRRAHRQQIDALISAWTRQQDKFEVMERLQRAWLAAGALLNAKELVENPHLSSRGFFVQAEAPDGGRYPMPGTPIVVNGQRRRQWQAAPGHGEHNAVALKEILGLSDEEIESLVASGALVGGPPRPPSSA